MSLNVHQLFNKKSSYARQTRTFLFFFIFALVAKSLSFRTNCLSKVSKSHTFSHETLR